MLDGYADRRAIVRDVAEIVRPPRRVSVSQAASEVVKINTPGGYCGPWDPSLTPYMVEPMNALKSREYRAVVLCAPARSGKTQGLIDGWLAHCITADPGDIGLYFSTQALAFDFRKRRIARLHRHSPLVRDRLSKRSHDTTLEMITYRSGMILNLGWPTSSQLAQRDLRYVALSDYDSFPDDIGGEGSAFEMASKRVQNAMSAGMALVESSPKRVQTSARFKQRTIHEAPPTAGGILPIYNLGDRRRWYWTCFKGCKDRFEAPALPAFEDFQNEILAAKTSHVACPHCGQVYLQKNKHELNCSGLWVKDPDCIGSDIASFWLLGCASAFQTWKSLVKKYVAAVRHADQSGDETLLAASTNMDQAMPYRPRALDSVRGTEYLDERKEKSVPRFSVPPGVRGLLAQVDVQANRFEVLVVGHGEHNEKWFVDRFKLDRFGDSPLRPDSLVEHWDILIDRAVNATYKIDSDRRMRVHSVAVDSGGAEGVTELAYAWWRSLRKKKLAHRVYLAKGEGQSKATPMVRQTFPDSSKRRDRPSGGRGDVPVLLLNSDKLKDAVYADLQRDVPGPGFIHFPDWTPQSIFDELTSEQRGPKGWASVSRRRNETWDLLCYNRALWRHLGGDGIDWGKPPSWLSPWDGNVEVLSGDQNDVLREKTKCKRKIEVGVKRQPRQR